MFFLLVNVAIAVWMYLDGKKRQFNAIPWSLGAVLFAVVVTPIYLARRPLLEGEVREGGFAWNALKYFAIGWTILMFSSAIIGIISASAIVDKASSEAEQVGASIGVTLGLGLLCSMWFFPLLGTAALAFLLRKPSIVERGVVTGTTQNASVTVSASTVAAARRAHGQTTLTKPSTNVRPPEPPLKPEANPREGTIRRPPPPPPPPKRT